MKILVAGDFCPQNRVSDLFAQEKYGEVLDGVKNIILPFDYSIVNFECPIRIGGESKNLDRLSLYCSPNGLEAVKYAGFNCVTLANNHFRDWGDEGVKNTLNSCKEIGIDYVGGGENLIESSSVLYKTIGAETLAIINCCEHEFSIATDKRGGSNPLNPVCQYKSITEARKKADYVVVIVHGGHEHYQLPSPRMVELYRFFVEVGADAVINHHQHCISGYESYKGKPIFYGIGNFCFDNNLANTPMWHVGFFVSLCLTNNVVNFEIIPYTQCKEDADIKPISYNEVVEDIASINSIISNPQKLLDMTNKYYNDSMSSVESVIEPYTNRLIRILRRLGLFPNLVTKKWLMYLSNYTMCESHRDKMEYYFEHKIY